MADWQALSALTHGEAISVERVRMTKTGVRIEGAFDLPPLALLAAEDQVFVSAFVRCHGSIKEMEKVFGVSYPTIKNRLNRIAAALPAAEVNTAPLSTSALLTKLERGEMSVHEVLSELKVRP